MPTVRLATLGCKVNQYETQYVKELLERNGHVEAAAGEPADLCVVNTCTVTHEGDAKSRQLIRRLHQAQPAAAIVVMGCYATRDPAAVGRLPGVRHVITDKARLVEEMAVHGVTAVPRGISRFDDHQRAFVKVQDGCLLNCTFCIIPSVRPVVRSRPVEEIVDEVERLAANGYREIVLTGVHLGHYGIDLAAAGRSRGYVAPARPTSAALPGDFRVRLSSLEAAEGARRPDPGDGPPPRRVSAPAPVPAVGVGPHPGGDEAEASPLAGSSTGVAASVPRWTRRRSARM
ncbi:MAG: radical SAM protein [Gemmataceae bacterium]